MMALRHDYDTMVSRSHDPLYIINDCKNTNTHCHVITSSPVYMTQLHTVIMVVVRRVAGKACPLSLPECYIIPFPCSGC